MYSLPCGQCDQSITVTASKAGQEVECPRCGQTVVVPKLGELKGLAGLASGDELDPTAVDSSNPSAAGSILFVFLALLATGCLVVATFCGIRWFLIDVPSTTGQHIAEIEAALMDASAAQLIVEYENLEKYGIDVDQPFGYQVIANTKAKWGYNALVAAAIGGVALIGAALSAMRR
jgi:ribosomal protein S27E